VRCVVSACLSNTHISGVLPDQLHHILRHVPAQNPCVTLIMIMRKRCVKHLLGLHYAILDQILHNLIQEADLVRVQGWLLQDFSEGLSGR
jgi:hypothetical protein